MAYRGQVRNGVILLDEGIELAEGTKVRVELLDAKSAHESSEGASKVPTLYERLKPFIGAAKDLPPDMSVNLDHYLYGVPKKDTKDPGA